ncbi:MAG: TonB-dependent receptor [Gemmatimonadaceae bacterium]|nr:TonB-dependent receptor [Gemmatimonadaceae bacterium]
MLVPGLATAQDTARVQPLPPLSVTASRTPVSIFDVPLAVTLIGFDVLRSRRGVSLDEALALVPGVLAQSRSGGGDVRISIRGFGSRGAGDRSNAGTTRGVRILIDGIPETEPDGRTSLDLVDLALVEQVEVLRSNASALYGNAAAGVLDLRTIPAAGAGRASVQTQAGSFGLRRVIGRVSAPVAGGTLYGGVANTHIAGWRAHSQSDRTTVLAGIATSFTERTSLAVLVAGGNDRFQIPGPLTRAQADTAPELANATYAARDERRHNRLMRIGATLQHRLDTARTVSGMLFVAPKMLQRSERGTFRDFSRVHLGGNLVYRAMHPIGATIRGRFTAGLDEAFQDGAILFYSLTPAGQRGLTLRNDKREAANNAGAFVEEQLAIGERLIVTAGARQDAITYRNQDFLVPTLDASRTFRRFTPKVGAIWKLGMTHSLYANVGGGVEVPAGNETDPASTFGQDTVTSLNPLLEPIHSTTYEVGLKRSLVFGGETALLRSASYDIALYDTEVRNEIVPYRGGRFYFTAGRVRRQGAELGLAIAGRSGLGARGALTLNRHRYVAYTVDSVHYGAPGRFADYAGNTVVGVPALHYGGSLSYAPHALPLRLEAGVTGVGRYYADDANAVAVPGHVLVDARVAFDDPFAFGRGLGLRGFVSVNNLTGRHFIGSAFLNPDVVNGAAVAFEPGRPREVVFGLTVGAL